MENIFTALVVYIFLILFLLIIYEIEEDDDI